MKKLISFLMVFVLIVAIAVPVFAEEYNIEWNGESVPDIDAVWTDKGTYPYAVIYVATWTNPNTLCLTLNSVQPVGNTMSGTYYQMQYVLKNGQWEKYSGPGPFTYTDFKAAYNNTVWASFDWYNSDGSFHYQVPKQCDGSTCPATDVNHDNICDDCGNVLAFSLRSTLLSFAQAHAESFRDYPYYAIVEHETEDTYNVYMTNQPMTADAETGSVVTGQSLVGCTVYTNSDGTFAYTGNNGVSSWTGGLIYANHDIANFRMPPLAVVIQGVTGEALEVEMPNLAKVMKILVLCGVGCLALLIGLKLFGKRWLIFRKT